MQLRLEVLLVSSRSDRKKDLSKMKSLLNILTDPNTRWDYFTLFDLTESH